MKMLSMKSVAMALDTAAPFLVAPALVLAESTVARAAPAEMTVRHEAVSYGDLNLASPSGMATLKVRVNNTAQAVCGPTADPRDLGDAADYKVCVVRAVRDAIAALPETREHASRPGHAG